MPLFLRTKERHVGIIYSVNRKLLNNIFRSPETFAMYLNDLLHSRNFQSQPYPSSNEYFSDNTKGKKERKISSTNSYPITKSPQNRRLKSQATALSSLDNPPPPFPATTPIRPSTTPPSRHMQREQSLLAQKSPKPRLYILVVPTIQRWSSGTSSRH